jgi:hypothetical protein
VELIENLAALSMGSLTSIEDKLKILDDYLLEPNHISPPWVSMLREYRAWLAGEMDYGSYSTDILIAEKLRLIDEYLAYPREDDVRWVAMIQEYRVVVLGRGAQSG